MTDAARECAEETISGFPAVVIREGADGKPLTTYDYWHAVGDVKNEDFFSLGYTWADKPHRLLYDLLKFIEIEHAKYFPPAQESETRSGRQCAEKIAAKLCDAKGIVMQRVLVRRIERIVYHEISKYFPPSVPVSKLEALRDDLKLAITEAHNDDQRISLEVVVDDLDIIIAEAK